jgi:hypothetical protein
MKRKRVCLTLLIMASIRIERAKERLVQFSKSIGEPILYPSVGVYCYMSSDKLEEHLNENFPPMPSFSIKGLTFGAWVFKN